MIYLNGHDIGTYKDDWVTVTYCKKCGKEGIELAMVKCPGEDQEKKKEKFVSGLPEWD